MFLDDLSNLTKPRNHNMSRWIGNCEARAPIDRLIFYLPWCPVISDTFLECFHFLTILQTIFESTILDVVLGKVLVDVSHSGWILKTNIFAVYLNAHSLPGVSLADLPIFSQPLVKELVRHLVYISTLSQAFRDRSYQVTSSLLYHAFLDPVQCCCFLHDWVPQ